MENSEQEYIIMDDFGMVIEKSMNFNRALPGYLTDIIKKSRGILNADEKDGKINSIEVFFDNSIILIKDDIPNNLNISTLIKQSK
jgi:hypothetical protein